MVEHFDLARVAGWRSHATALLEALESKAWDGAWYHRATFDDGTVLGSAKSDECCIDSIAQSWAVLSGVGDPVRARQAMSSLDQHLIRRDDHLMLLFSPPFDKIVQDPGYIKGYPPGLRENGGQYNHAAMWAIMAFAKLGQGDLAAELFALVNPVLYSDTAEASERYKVEPYVVAADVYSMPPHTGRGGWTWYTGSSGLMYRVGIESILGLRQHGGDLLVNPCIPGTWSGFEVTIRKGATCYHIKLKNKSSSCNGISYAELDDKVIELEAGELRCPLDGKKHKLFLVL